MSSVIHRIAKPLSLAALVAIVAVAIAATPNTASAQHQHSPTFQGTWTGLSKGQGRFNSSAVRCVVSQQTRAIDHARRNPHHRHHVTSLIAGRMVRQSFRANEWYVLWSYNPATCQTHWIAMHNHECKLHILQSDGHNCELPERASHKLHFHVSRCEHFVYAMDLIVRNDIRHDSFAYQVCGHTERIVRPQPRPRRPVNRGCEDDFNRPRQPVIRPRNGHDNHDRGHVYRYVERRDDNRRRDRRGR